MSVETSNSGKTIYLKIGVWYDSEKQEIHLAAPETQRFHTTVNNKSGSIRRHSNLYQKLASELKSAGAPYPDEIDLEKDS